MSSGRLLAVFAHPDDESLVAGGTLAACAAAGVEVRIVSVTHGERGPIAHPSLATRASLGAVRAAELRAAAVALGVGAVQCLDYPDGALKWSDPDRLRDDLAGRIRDWRPDAIITFGPEGLYWHRDHIAVHSATMAALETLAAEGIAPWVYHATWPHGLAESLVSALAARGDPADLWGLRPGDFGVPAETITSVVDVRPFLAAKLRALRSHRTQLHPAHLLLALPDDLAWEFLGREYFVRPQPRDAAADWLAGATRSQPSSSAPSRQTRARTHTLLTRPSGPNIVVLGMMGRSPFAGVGWQVLHYLEGLRRLGCHVTYLEDTGEWPYDPEQNAITDDCRYTTAYIGRLLAWCGLDNHWAYRAASQGGQLLGPAAARVDELLARADALINLTGATVLRDEHLRVPVRIFLETDPVRPQIEVAQGCRFTIDLLAAHTHYFSFGENFGAPDCGVPLGRFDYRPTRQPIVLEWWNPARAVPPSPAADGRFTTVASWDQSGKDIEWRGQTYSWSKHHEFLKFLDLPHRTERPFELALACDDAAVLRLLGGHGWRVVDALALSKDIRRYRDYILGSWGEFTVAKDQNIRLRSGWFSDRSASYLAAGKPVITQDTGFGKILPTGRGLFAFRTMEDVLAAVDAIESDYEGHSRAAREIAAESFAAEKVVASLLQRAGV
jgi:LmbE family N-acetylglucosaminyl deacetylase